jgi:photosystem II stability/assembly factor-like uncharacterized protein/cytoskeletal protein CcmA (bactofilin family)
MASFQKNFVVKNGLEVGLDNGSILLATSDGVGIGSTAPTEALSVVGDVKISGITTILSNVVIGGNLTVNGTEVIINTATLEVEDINIGIASAPSKLNNFQLDGAGITIYGSDGDKTLSWDNSNSRLAFNTDVYAPNLNIGGSTSFFDLDVDGHTELDTLNVSGISTFGGDLDVDGHTELDTLNVSGISTFGGIVNIGGDLDVDGHTELDTLNVSGITTTQNLEVSSHALLNTLNISGISTFGGDLDVDGHTELDALRVSGISTLTNHLQIRSDDGNEGRVDFYCEVSNLHYTRLQAAPHSSYSGNATVVLPNSDGTLLLTDGSGADLTNLNADNILSGTIPDGRFPAVLPAIDGSNLTLIDSEFIKSTQDSPSFSEDFGKVWSKVELNGIGAISSIVYCGNGIVLVSNFNNINIYRSTDYGQTFISYPITADTPPLGGVYDAVVSLEYAGNGVLFAGTGNTSSTGDGQVLKSTDYGLTWRTPDISDPLIISPFVNQIKTITYCGDNIVLAGGGFIDDGTIYRSTNLGETWTFGFSTGTNSIEKILYCGNGVVLAGTSGVDDEADIYRSTDNGSSWTKIEMGSTLNGIQSLVYCGNGIILAGGGSGTNEGDIYRSTDTGLTWTKIEMGSTIETIESLVYCGNGIVFAGGGTGGGDGNIYKSTDFGLTWSAAIEIATNLDRIEDLVYCGNGILLSSGGNDSGDGDIYRCDMGFSQASTIQGIYHQNLTGNIGFGTANPSEKLDFVGNAAFQNDVLINGTASATTFSGSGADLTNLNADNILSGTIPDGRFPAVLPAIDGSALTNIVSGIGIGTSPGFVGFGITVLNFQGPGVSTATIDSATGIGTIFFEGGGGGGSISVSLVPPSNPDSGDLWYSPDHARTFIYYDENVVGYGTDAYWIDSAPFHIPPGNAIPGISTTGTTIFNNLSVSGNVDVDGHTELDDLSVSGNVDVDGHTELDDLSVSGVITATSYYGSGSNLTGITESQIVDLGNYATLSYVNSEVAGIVSSAPAALDTLNELASALNDDANFATTITNQLSLKANLSGPEFSGITTFNSLIDGVDMVLSGIGTAQEFDALSDINYKKNVKTVENGLDKIISLRGVSYDWKQSDRSSYGVIAQELEEILPELVHGGFGDDPKTVNYNGIIGIMIESIKELRQEVETLKKIINN